MMAQVPRLRPGFRFQWEPVQDSHVLLYPEGMVKLNTSASAILAEIDGHRPVADIIARLEQQFPDAGELTEDVCEFIRDARQKHWIEFNE